MHERRTNSLFACTFTVKNRLKDLLHWGTSLRISAFDCPFDFLFALEEISNCVSIKTSLPLRYIALSVSISYSRVGSQKPLILLKKRPESDGLNCKVEVS